MDVGDALSQHIEQHLTSVSEKYFDNPIESHVVMSKGVHAQVQADITVHVGRNIVVQGHDAANDAYAAFDGAADKIARQLRKYKDRLKNHHKRVAEQESLPAQQYVLATDTSEEEMSTDLDEQPAVIAEMATNIDSLTVSEAVMRMDLSNSPVVIFKNRSHGGVNVIYRREDGNISWIDPEGFKKAAE